MERVFKAELVMHFLWSIHYCLFCSLFIMNKIDGEITISIYSPPKIIVNQTVTFQCTFSNIPTAIQFKYAPGKSCSFDKSKCGKKICIIEKVQCANDTTFLISVIPERSWHNQEVSCRPAFGGNQSSIRLNIIIPVTSVTLAGAQIPVDAGKQITLTCQTDYCNPAANITWYKDSVDITRSALSQTDFNNSLVATFSTLRYDITVYDNNKNVYCLAKNIQGDEVLSIKHQLDVRSPVTSVTLTPAQITVDAGKQITLTCQTDYCNPAANITWYKDSADVTSHASSSMDIDSNSLVRTTSVLQYTGVAGDNGQQVYCKATNGPGNNIESNICILHVRYPPSTAPVITASPSGLEYNTETTVNLTCQLSGGNPIAMLSWICKNTGITGINQSNSTTAVAVLSLVMDSSYNNQLCTCTANHSLLTSPKSTSVSLTVFYVPNSAPQLTPIGFTSVDEGQNISLRCTLPTLGNPHVAWSWYCNEDTIPEGVSNTGTQSVLTFTAGRKYNQRTCHCRATTTRATLPYDEISIKQSITVFYNNIITSNWNQTYYVREQESIQLVCEVDGNPSSNITWEFVRNNSVIKQAYNVKISLLNISSANCLDYGTYQVTANNGKGPYANKTANLSVKCKPRLYMTDSLTPVRIGIKNNESLQIFVRILLFPQAINTSWIFSRRKNESKVIRDSIDGYSIAYVNGDVEQNITLYKEGVNKEDFGNYTLRVANPMGVFTRVYHVDSTRPPLMPMNFTVVCENSLSINLSWISNFNGGDDQSFQVSYSTNEHLTESHKVLETNINDEGYGKSHSYTPTIELQGDLWFRINASNKFGSTTSDVIYCSAVKKVTVSSDNLPIIAGAATGGLIFAGLVILGIVFFLRTMKESKGKKKNLHQSDTILTEERESNEDDGLKENKLYISAGPRDDEIPGISGTAVYAEVNKRGPTSDNNANVYAEVQKSGKTAKDQVALYSDTTKQKKGFFKKEEKAKQKKAKKIKQNKEVTDVYENPEEIVMTQNVDNVYSNTAESNGTKRNKNGYKNQDGLLYVEVQFDQARQDSGKPVIHGEDEKTDYATVEFPFPPSSNNDKPTDEK